MSSTAAACRHAQIIKAAEAHVEPLEEASPGYEPLHELDHCLEFEALPAGRDVLDEGLFPAGEQCNIKDRSGRRLPPPNNACQIPGIHFVNLHR